MVAGWRDAGDLRPLPLTRDGVSFGGMAAPLTPLILPAWESVRPSAPEDAGSGLVAGTLHLPERTVLVDPDLLLNLLRRARAAARLAYAPFSKFRVGAALIMADDPAQSIITGANVENSSYSLTQCAERTALPHAAAQGHRRLRYLDSGPLRPDLRVMRIVIIGTGGRVGGALARHFRLAGHAVVGFDRTALDLTRPEIIRDRLEPLAFDTVLLPAAVTNLDYAEAHPEETWAANVDGPALVATLGAARGARMIHFSTDYTYDGTRLGLRVETEAAAPLSVYARSKAEGDRRVLEATEGAALIARVSWVFGPDRSSFPDQMIARAVAGGPLEAVADKFSTPTSALDLCAWLEPFVDGPHRDTGGIVNFCNGGEPASWHSYGQAALDLAAGLGVRLRATTVTPRRLGDIAAFKAPRPVHTAMSHQKLASLLGSPPRPWTEALRDYLRTYHAPA